MIKPANSDEGTVKIAVRYCLVGRINAFAMTPAGIPSTGKKHRGSKLRNMKTCRKYSGSSSITTVS